MLNKKQLTFFLNIIIGVGFVIITVATVYAQFEHLLTMYHLKSVKLHDLLLLFIYLEILTMVGLYISTGKLPIRYPIYIAVVAIARNIIINMEQMSGWSVVALTLAILVLTLAALVLRFGQSKLPYLNHQEE